jgi:hypothetical protein
MTHYQQLQRFAQDDKWAKLQADLERGHPSSKKDLTATLDAVISKAQSFKNSLQKGK